MSSTSTAFLFFLSILLWSDGCSAQSKDVRRRQLNTQSQIVERLFNNYDSYSRPPIREDSDHSAIVVITSIHINRIQWLTYTAEVDLYLRQQWQDSRLSYDIDTREGIDEIALPQNKEIWRPDTYFGTAREKSVGTDNRDRFVVEPTGDVRGSEQRLIEVPVENSIAFPFQNQKSFRLRLASYNYPIEDLVYLWANHPPRIVPVEVSRDLLDGEAYTLTEAFVGDCVGNYTVGMYSCIDVIVTFKGAATAPIFQLFLPSVLLVIFSWLQFFIHPSFTVPRSFSAAIPFIAFTLLVVFYPQPHLHKSGVGATQVWLVFSLGITFASLLEYFLVICSKSKIRRLPPPITTHSNEHAPLSNAAEGIELQYEGKRGNLQVTSTIDVVSRFIFPLVYIVFIVIFFVFYLL